MINFYHGKSGRSFLIYSTRWLSILLYDLECFIFNYVLQNINIDVNARNIYFRLSMIIVIIFLFEGASAEIIQNPRLNYSGASCTL